MPLNVTAHAVCVRLRKQSPGKVLALARPASVKTTDLEREAGSEMKLCSCNRCIASQSRVFHARLPSCRVRYSRARTASSILFVSRFMGISRNPANLSEPNALFFPAQQLRAPPDRRVFWPRARACPRAACLLPGQVRAFLFRSLNTCGGGG